MQPHVRVSAAACLALLLTLPAIPPSTYGQDVGRWLRTHKPIDFSGQVYARFAIEQPKDIAYAVIVDSETNPYGPMRQATGTMWATGLQKKTWAGDHDWGKPLAWIEPKNNADWLRAGQKSPWVKLPTSKASQWHTAFFVRVREKELPRDLRLQLDFASAPDEQSIFHHSDEHVDKVGAVAVRMPTTGGEAGLRMVQAFGEWARARAARVDSLSLGPPPHLNKLRINTWTQLQTYRWLGANAPRERAQPDFHSFELLGINDLSLSGVDDDLFRELASRHHILFGSRTAWAAYWPYTTEGYQHQYDFRPGENPKQRWTRVFESYYSKLAAADQKENPFAFSIADHINLGDEVGPVTTPAEIAKTPSWLADFRDWLKEQRLEPTDLGAASWDGVQATDDRSRLTAADVQYARLFYCTRRYIDQQTTIFYRAATDAVRKYYPHARLITVNFQAGPMHCAYIGNSNDFDRGELDLFELGRNGFQGTMTEDWVDGSTDFGIGRICMGAQILAAAARKRGDPTASYVVGGEAIRAECMANLMHGVKELVLYLYGPIQNIGPAWSEDPKALRQIAELTRELKPLEDLIAVARPRRAKVALLVASTADIMQVKGLYFLPERQNVYLALAHAGVPVDIICEQEILEDNILDQYKALYFVDPQTRTAVLERIAAWVDGGGHLWASVGTGQWDEFNQKSTILDPALGVTSRAMMTQPDGLKPTSALWAAIVTRFGYKPVEVVQGPLSLWERPGEGVDRRDRVREDAERKRDLPSPQPSHKGRGGITVWGARLECIPSTAQVVAKYDDGSPAILRNKYGQGEALLVGLLAGEAYARAHYPVGKSDELDLGAAERRLVTDALKRWNIASPLELSAPGIYSSNMDAPGATLVFLNNASEHKVEKLELLVPEIKSARRIRSAKRAHITTTQTQGGLTITLPLANTEILAIER